jgi:hypothetical protein
VTGWQQIEASQSISGREGSPVTSSAIGSLTDNAAGGWCSVRLPAAQNAVERETHRFKAFNRVRDTGVRETGFPDSRNIYNRKSLERMQTRVPIFDRSGFKLILMVARLCGLILSTRFDIRLFV